MTNLISSGARDRGIRSMFPAHTEAALMQGDLEVLDPGYTRQPVAWDSAGDGCLVNNADMWFPAFHVAVTSAVDGWALYDGDELLAMGEFNPCWPRPGDVMGLTAGMVRVALA